MSVMINDRQVYRRLEPIHIMLGLLVVAGAVIEAIVGTGGVRARVAGSIVFIDGLALVYFLGPAATVVVTPQFVHVNNVFIRHVIAREAVEGVTESRSSARLSAAGRTFRVTAFNDRIYARNGPIGTPATSRKVRRIIRMMDEVPPSGRSHEQVHSRIRYPHALLAAAAVLSAVVSFAYLVTRTST
jgi:hypothetical protein